MLFLATQYLTYIFIKYLDQMIQELCMIIPIGAYPLYLGEDIGKYGLDPSFIL
jgi:hypothetical protein